ncbi:MAG: LamG-like jellyroll fold domain-containing protein [Planctomycetota bacterium]|jgi:hypothetical protein
MRKKLILLASFVLVLGLAVSVANAAPLLQDPGPDGIVSVEAEHYDDNVEQGGIKWQEVGQTAGGFTGTAGMQCLGPNFYGSGYAATSPRLDYEINFVKTGTHYVWILGWSTSGTDDSCHVGLDGEERPLSSNWSSGPRGNNWSNGRYPEEETRAQFEVTKPGLHVLNIWVREDGLIIDKIVLTTNPDFTLTESEPGPPESPRGVRAVAAKPSPVDGATDVPRDVVLSWVPGAHADKHNVYFGTVFDDVSNGIGGITQDANSYAPPRLDFETTYYWRVDEVDAPPDSTIREGNVWSFTTELFAYPIENVSATASSQAPNKGPENTVNGSGLDASGLLHGKDADDNMWQSSMAGPQPSWIEFQFDNVYKLYELWVWNSNDTLEPIIGLGFKDVSIEYSANGTDYTTLGTTTEFARAPGMPDYAHDTTIDMGGVPAKYVRLTANSNWGGIFTQYGLSEVRFFYIPVNAREPSPDSGATGVDLDVILGFRAGREAVTHDVYVSTDEQAVIDGTAPVATVAKASYGPLSLDLDVTHYWKVNEVNEAETPTTWESNIWSFTTTDNIVVDDFESYNDLEPTEPGSKRIFNVWIDGFGVATNGSLVGYENPPFCETSIVHGGEQSMPLSYSNTGGAAYSEATLTLSSAQDWTAAGVKTLAVHFYGAESNTGQLYVKINGTKVPYDGQAGNLALTGWQAWNIDLASSGASLQNVTKLAVGIDGNGASGTLYFDDIGLYAYERQFITPSAPDDSRLIGHWKFDGDLQDSSGRGNHGTAGASAAFVAGKVGSNAVDLRGADYVVIDGVVDDITSTNITLSAWIRTTQEGEGNVFAANTASGGHPLMFGVQGGNPFVNDGGDTQFGPPVNDDLWHLITYVRDGNTGYVYADGVQQGTYSASFSLASVTRWSIGQEWDTGPSDFYTGAVDDARIYDYPLSAGEVGWLAGRTEPFDKPF